MDHSDLSHIRNLGVIAHIDAGKTTTSEHLLFYAGVKRKLGGVDAGTTDTDYDPEEQQRGITIYSACIPFNWRGHRVNLIDTPGHVDFTAEVERSLRVLDGAIVVFDGQKGVEAQSETVWRQANAYKVPRLVFINKMDVVGADYAKAIASIHKRLTRDTAAQGQPVPIVIPIGAGSVKDSPNPFKGIVDLIEWKAIYYNAEELGQTWTEEEIPEESQLDAEAYREQLFDALTQHDEHDLITSTVLEGKIPDKAKIRQLIREQTLNRKIFPVLAGSGREHIGVQPLLDAVTYYLPSPLDVPPVQGVHPKSKKEEIRKTDVKEPFAGLVFKTAWHPNGHRFFIRVYSGVLKPNSRMLNAALDRKENVAKLFHVHANPNKGLEEVPNAPAGDIVVCIGLKETRTGDTLCDAHHPILLESISFAAAVVSQSIEPELGADRDKLVQALEMLQLEDPTFLVKIDKDTGQTLMSGMGTLHLEVKQHRLDTDFRVKVRVGKPRVSYRETLTTPKTVEIEIDKVGQRDTYAYLKVEFSNHESLTAVTVTNFVSSEQLPVALAEAAVSSLKGALQTGEFGYPMMNVQAKILEAKFDPQTSIDDAFSYAAGKAYREATAGNVTLLEPIMRVLVTTPDEFLGNVISDLSTHGGEIERSETLAGDISEVEAKAPLRELFDYADRVRSLSQGRAASSMEPERYKPAPDHVRRELLGE